jgi:hypothetical protein
MFSSPQVCVRSIVGQFLSRKGRKKESSGIYDFRFAKIERFPPLDERAGIDFAFFATHQPFKASRCDFSALIARNSGYSVFSLGDPGLILFPALNLA